jgi:hypothetical protein
MKEQYVADINDYRKYALLRRLQAGSGLRIGVCWMLTPSDGSRDGRKLAYLNEPKEARHDAELFRLLREVARDPDARRLQHIEESGILSGAIYFNNPVPDLIVERQVWFRRALTELRDAQLIFFDPDNGLDVPSTSKGTKASSKYLYRDEVVESYRSGHSLLIYQHFPHEKREVFVPRIRADLKSICPDAGLWAFTTSDVVFFLVVQPSHHTAIHQATQSVGTFDAKFLRAETPHAG